MKVVVLAITIGIVAYFAQSFGPWWSGVVVAFICAAVAQLLPGQSFVAGFLGLGVMWAVQAGILDANNDGILSARIGVLLGGISGMGLLLITCGLGGLLGGLGGLSGTSGMRWIIGKRT